MSVSIWNSRSYLVSPKGYDQMSQSPQVKLCRIALKGEFFYPNQLHFSWRPSRLEPLIESGSTGEQHLLIKKCWTLCMDMFSQNVLVVHWRWREIFFAKAGWLKVESVGRRERSGGGRCADHPTHRARHPAAGQPGEHCSDSLLVELHRE